MLLSDQEFSPLSSETLLSVRLQFYCSITFAVISLVDQCQSYYVVLWHY